MDQINKVQKLKLLIGPNEWSWLQNNGTCSKLMQPALIEQRQLQMNGANPNDIVASQVSVDSTWKNVFLTDKFGTLKKQIPPGISYFVTFI